DVRVIRIAPADFNHGLTRNLAAMQARGKLLIMTVQDAAPLNEHWLESMVKNFDDDQVAGVFCRQIPREDADVLTKRNLNGWVTARSEKDIHRLNDRSHYDSLSPMDKYLFCVFDDVCSCIRKSVWQQFPFPKTQFAEDLYFSRNALFAGLKIVYAPEAGVVHSHNRSSLYEFKRTYICHRKLNELFGLQTVPTMQHVLKFIWGNIVSDSRYVWNNEPNRLRALAMLFRIPFLSVASVYGQYKGARDQVESRALESTVGV
ncbi:MAG TPA: hypothetical protein VKS81_09125, partial [Bacteroidota bacterium]|nr:hypothetical protein [Bacteroidota bacterium]